MLTLGCASASPVIRAAVFSGPDAAVVVVVVVVRCYSEDVAGADPDPSSPFFDA